ncbi:MAG: peptidylprolyl isomerase [Candidatus Omnitrophica bacterium]|nr:peptidylprolyl isomerase [Candidatus Omnitrophota bacterium]
MRRIIFVSILITVLALFTALSGAAVVDKIVVVVNNEIITQREVDVILAPIYGQYRSMYKGEELIRMLEDAREKILKQLIEDRLIFSEAKKLNITIDEKEIDAKVDEVRNKVGSERDLENMLHEQNLTLNELRARYKEKIMIRKLVDQKVGAKIIITPLEVKDYYNDNKESFMQPEEIKLRTILIKPRKEQGGEAGSLQLMRDLVKRLKEGCDFEELAKEYSDAPDASEGGLMGYVRKGELLPQIEDIVFNLKEGEVTGIIKSPLGYHVFRVDEKRIRRIRELSEVRQDVEEFLYREKANQKLRGWIDSLAKSAYIEFK